MNGVDRVERRKSLKERLGLKGMSCCGATWGLMPVTEPDGDDDDEEAALPQQQLPSPQQPLQEHVEVIDLSQTPPANLSDHGCLGQSPAWSGMNLATALAEERQYRAAQDSDGGGGIPEGPANNRLETAPQTPSRTSLMRLLVESDGENGERETTEKEERGVGFDCMCCVCMGRKKGAAFIPCGHTFCRVCSRELWLNRGSCPLCNRPILEILDIF